MSLRQAITDFSSFLQAAPPVWRTPQTTRIAFDLSRRAALARGPHPETDFAPLHKKFHKAIAHNDWREIDSVDWNDITYLLWKSEPGLLTFNKFQMNYRRYLESSKTARPFKRLIYAYLEAYDPTLPGIEWAGALIRRILLQKRYYILEYWREIELDLEVFSLSPGPQRFALRCLDHPESPLRPHHDLGLPPPLSGFGFAQQAYQSAAHVLVHSKLQSEAELSRLKRFLDWTLNDSAKPFLRFPKLLPHTFAPLLPAQLPPRPACILLAQFFTAYAAAWREGDPSCKEPTSKEIEIMGRILALATSPPSSPSPS